MSRLKKIDLSQNKWERYTLQWEYLSHELFWGKIRKFIDNSDLIIECCCGTGDFISEKSSENRNKKYIGIDYSYTVLQRAVKKSYKQNLDNVKFIYNDINKIFSDFDKSLKNNLKKIYINFPDPWPKRKHWKRRVIQTDFLIKIYNIMSNSTKLIIITDHDGYAKWIVKKLDKLSNKFSSKNKNWYTLKQDLTESSYYKKAMKKNNNIYYFEVLKK